MSRSIERVLQGLLAAMVVSTVVPSPRPARAGLPGAATPVSPVARPPLDPRHPSVFRIEVLASPRATDAYGRYVGPTRPPSPRSCVATRIGDHWALTASHCMPDASPRVRATWFDRNGRPGTTAWHTVEVVRHPTHDVALLRLDPTDERGPAWTVSEVTGSPPAFLAIRPPSDPGETGLVVDALREVSRDAHVLRLTSTTSCLRQGDSGTPIIATPTAGELPDVGAIVGILISGSPSCPGTQTVVRLDSLRPWLRRQVSDREQDETPT